MNRKTLFLLLGGIIIGVGLGVLILYGFGDGELLPGADVQTGPSGPQPAANFPAPDFTLERLDGQQVSLQDHRGKYVLLNFWATWCAPCREEMPHIQAQYEQHSAALAVLA
ncbi:MAG: TlpA family protein disulfide reductase, partial [Chloroflexi bacterium]|nr:TlpA family protein disulfide reductase [Chloroflexota bacterium]